MQKPPSYNVLMNDTVAPGLLALYPALGALPHGNGGQPSAFIAKELLFSLGVTG